MMVQTRFISHSEITAQKDSNFKPLTLRHPQKSRNTQIFRNLPFFEFCSYTVEDIYSRPWHELFVREQPAITQKILSMIAELIANVNRKMMFPDLGVQTTREFDSAKLFVVDLTIKSLGVLFDTKDQPQAILSVEHASHQA